MIKINLLPVKASRKRENIKQQLIAFVGVIALTVLGLFYWYYSVSGTITSKNKEIQEKRDEIARLEREIGDVDKYKGLETELTTKLEVIDSLMRNKTGPVRVMDRLGRIMPRKVWLTKWEDKGGTVNLEGEALSNKDVGDFMEMLQRPVEEDEPSREATGAAGNTPASEVVAAKGSAPGKHYFTDIQLKESELKEDKSVGQPFVKFSLLLKVKYQL